ncbi:hypothetical protein [Nonomuraea sp. NPDC052265]|uniref:hypothetical protein n=1 Tax=Nonomuraea sp. NPDC052265 TaxID=3364374 RepID=UPI0037C623BF
MFFDLVVVVAVAQLVHRLQHPTWENVALFGVLYYAVMQVVVSASGHSWEPELAVAASAVLGVALRAGWRWIWGWAVPTALAPLGVAALSGAVPGYVSVTLLLAVALWRLVDRPGRAGSDQVGSGRVDSAGDVLPA